MKKIFLILSLFLVQTWIVQAQQIISPNHVGKIDNSFVVAQLTLTGAGKNKSGGAPPPTCGGYAGPGDSSVFSGTTYAWYGLRAFSAATCGTVAVEVCQAGTTTCVDMVTSTSTGLLVVTTVSGTACTTLFNCDIRKIYDQSGANDCSGSPCTITFSPRPFLNAGATCGPFFACINGGTVASVAGASASGGTHAQPVTLSIVNYTITTPTVLQCMATTGGGVTPSFTVQPVTPNNISLYAGSLFNNTVSDATIHALNALFSNTASILNVDAVEGSTGATGTSGIAGGYNIGVTTTCPLNNILLGEVGFFGTTTSGQRNSIASNQKLVWVF